MKNTFGSSVALSVFGESHGAAVGAVLDGMAAGVKVDEHFIRSQLTLRRPAGKISTSRVEEDKFVIESGVYNSRTTGTPICIVIPNENTRSGDYSATRALARPGHADYTAYCKYHGFEDYRGGGHFSGRVTAGVVAAGAIAIAALREKGIYIGTHISRCGGVSDRPFGDMAADIAAVNAKVFAVLDSASEQNMLTAIEAAARDGDSVGGVLETAVTGLPEGVGEPFFDTLESVLAHALFAVPAVKGVEFGSGFALADMRGSAANDPFAIKGGRVTTVTNNNGGINGGITNGMPVIFRCAIRPTPSIARKQQTVSLKTGEDAELEIHGRHDPCILPRAVPVIEAMAAIAVLDMWKERQGCLR